MDHDGSSVIFDRAGRPWHLFDLELGRRLTTHLSGMALADYTVRNMGYVLVGLRPQGALMRVRPGFSSPPAVAGALHLLRAQRVDRVLISVWSGTWRHQLLPLSLFLRFQTMRDPISKIRCVGV